MTGVPTSERVFISGGTGLVGSAVAEAVSRTGTAVTILVRPGSDRERARRAAPAATFFEGDVRNEPSLLKAMDGATIAIHAAADTTGTHLGGRETTIQGTRNVIRAAGRRGVRRLVYVSSCSVYSYADRPAGAVLTEASPTEPTPERRGPYSWAKTVAESEVADLAEAAGVEVVVVRPGIVYGPGAEFDSATVGVPVAEGLFIALGRYDQPLPMVHAADLAEAIVLAATVPGVGGETFNVVHPEIVTRGSYIRGLLRPAFPGRRVVRLPYGAAWLGAGVFETLFVPLRREPPLTRYRLASAQRHVTVSARLAQERLGWHPTRLFAESCLEMLEG